MSLNRSTYSYYLERSFIQLWTVLILTLLLVGCREDTVTTSHLSDSELSKNQTSRVFDGRDSVATNSFGTLVATQNNFSIITTFIEDENGESIVEETDDATLLYESRTGEQVLGPDGSSISWGDFRGAKGSVIVKCTNRGTHAVVHLDGLIPNGTYSVWSELIAPIGGDAIGRAGFTESDQKGKSKGNVIQASARGEGHFSGFMTQGALDEIGDCMLDDVKNEVYNWRIVGIYHFSGKADLAQEGTFVEQTAFSFENEPPVIIE